MSLERKQQEELSKLVDSRVRFDVESTKKEALALAKEGVPAEKIIEWMTEGMNEVGKKYASGEFFVPELIMAGETMREALDVLGPYMTGEMGGTEGTVVLATVAGDIHDIGKNIVATLLTTAGFKVIDLGVDVAAEKIVEAVRTSHAEILGMSALLTTNLEQIPAVIEGLKKEGLRKKVKVILGGATVTEEFAKKAGVDAYAKDALTGVRVCKGWARSG
jgi:5-methyltetrahydrofolate--homocysteine methyltransferase